MPTRAEQKELTREALLFAALEEFGEHGLDAPSLDAICARAGKTRGAFYVHFPDREALVVAVLERILEEYLTALATVASEDDGLRRAIDRFTDLLDRGSPEELGRFAVLGTAHFRVVFDARTRFPRAGDVFDRVIGAGIELLAATAARSQADGDLRPDVSPRSTAELLISVLLGILVLQQGAPTTSVTGIRDQLLQLLEDP